MTQHISAISRGPFAVGTVVFRDNQGQLVGTIVAKVTYALAPGIVGPFEEPLPIQEEDDHWDDDPGRSVHVPSDLAPFKKAPEVVVVGSAFAPSDRPASSVVTRIIVGSVDKSVEAWVPRFLREGTVEESPRARRFALRYEYAAGGIDSENPNGIDISRPDARGRRVVPQLLPVGFDIGSHTTHVPTMGMGPLPASSRTRSGELSAADRAWLAGGFRESLPPAFPTNYFQSAPMDQWLVRPLAANERIIVENLHQRHSRLVMTLSGIEPQAVMVGHAEPIRMRGDLLVIDSDRALCTLTFRGHVGLGDAKELRRVVVTAVPMGTMLSAEQVAAIAASASDETLGDDDLEIADDGMELTRDISPEAFAKMVPGGGSNALPFSGGPSSSSAAVGDKRVEVSSGVQNARQRTATLTPAAEGGKEETLPFTPAPFAARSRQASFADGLATPPMSIAPAMPPPIVTPSRPAPIASVPVVAPPPAPSAPAVVESKPVIEKAAFPPPIEPAKPVSLFAGLRAREPVVPRGAESKPGNSLSLQGASDAAAQEEKTREPVTAQAGRQIVARSAGQANKRLAVVDLLSFEKRVASRVQKWLAPLGAKPKAPLSLDEPQRSPADPDRDAILRVLSCVEGQGPADIRRMLANSLDDLSDFDPPLVLCSGELVPRFDEVEALRASVAVVTPVAGTDKRTLSAIAVAQEALAASIAPPAETLRNLAKQIETATNSLALPPRFVATHVERVLVENRSYKRRVILGSPRIRADFVLAGGEVFPLYVPDDAARSLPLLPSFPAITICEIRPREDLTEAQPEALVCLALGRVLHGRASS